MTSHRSATAITFALCAAIAGAGTSRIDHQADAWKLVPAGTCLETPSPTSPTEFGQLGPFTAVKSRYIATT